MICHMNKQIDALLIEREGYVRRGLKDRVEACDDALAALGCKSKVAEVETAAVEPVAERATRKASSKRKA